MLILIYFFFKPFEHWQFTTILNKGLDILISIKWMFSNKYKKSNFKIGSVICRCNSSEVPGVGWEDLLYKVVLEKPSSSIAIYHNISCLCVQWASCGDNRSYMHANGALFPNHLFKDSRKHDLQQCKKKTKTKKHKSWKLPLSPRMHPSIMMYACM